MLSRRAIGLGAAYMAHNVCRHSKLYGRDAIDALDQTVIEMVIGHEAAEKCLDSRWAC